MIAIYARQSKDRKESLSIEAQLEKCIQLCQFKGKEYKEYSDKGFSGKNTSRPQFENMITDIKAGIIDEVIVYRLDRISRNINDFTSTLHEFEKHGCTFASVTEAFDTGTPMGRAMMMILAVFAQLEREGISERLRDNKMYTVGTLGKWNGGRIPLGYKLTETLKEGKLIKTLAVDETDCDIIKEIFQLYADGSGLRRIMAILHEQGRRTSKGKYIPVSTLSKTIKNIFYASNSSEVFDYFTDEPDYIIQNERHEFDGTKSMIFFRRSKVGSNKASSTYVVISEHTPIISGELWAAANTRLNKKTPLPWDSGKSKTTFLSGLCRCGYCGEKMVLTYSHKYVAICCRTRRDVGKNECGCRNISVPKLEKIVEEYLNTTCDNPKNLKSVFNQRRKVDLKAQIKKLDSIIKNIECDIRDKTNDMSALVDNVKHISNVTLLRAVETETDKVSKELEGLSKALSRTKLERDSLSQDTNAYNRLEEAARVYKARWCIAKLDEKTAIIRALVKEIVITNGGVSIHIF